MRSRKYIIPGFIIAISILMIAILGFQFGGNNLALIRSFSALCGAFIGGGLVLLSANLPCRSGANYAPWLPREQISWTLIGEGCVAWGIGECFWRFYVSQGLSPFPSLADIGYMWFPILVLFGLIIQPRAKYEQKRLFLFLDSMIAMGALLSIAWFLFLGPLAQHPTLSPLAKAISLYYLTADMALLSCVFLLLLRGANGLYRTPARRTALIVLGIGLAIFASSDLLFNLRQNLGLPVDTTWVDLGWPLGMMTIGLAAYIRRSLPGQSVPFSLDDQEPQSHYSQQISRLTQALPSILLTILVLVIIINLLSPDPIQYSIRSVLIIATLIVVILVAVRQMVTTWENERLMQEQKSILEHVEHLYQEAENRSLTLEQGITHLKEIQTRLANGDFRARAHKLSGDLWPLATGLNLMADRMMRFEHQQRSFTHIAQALNDLIFTLEHRKDNAPFVLPPSCFNVPEIRRLLIALNWKPVQHHTSPQPTPPIAYNTPSPYS